MAVLPRYFEDAKKKAERASGVSPYSMPTGGDAGSAPAGGARPASASASAPTAAPTKGSGSGFVNFGTYFGANAPAIQAQAQKSVEQAKNTTPIALSGLTAQAMPTTVSAGGFGNVTMRGAARGAPRSDGSYESRIAEASRQFEGLNPAAQTGTMAAGTSLFDQMLGGGVTQRAAQAEQQRLGALRKALEEGQAEYTQREKHFADVRAGEEAANDALYEQQIEAERWAQAEEDRRYYEAMRAQQEAAGSMGMDQEVAPVPADYWEYDDVGEGGY